MLLFRPDAELRRLARLALDTGLAPAFSNGRSPAEIDAELAKSDAGSAWLEELEGVKDPWFNMSTGDGLYHYYRSWHDDPSIPYASIAGHISALEQGRLQERPTEELARERDRLAEGYAEQLTDEQRGPFHELLGLSRTVFPYVEEHKFYCDYWFLTAWYNKVREFGAMLVEHDYLDDVEDVFHLNRHEVLQALEELVLHWASGGLALGGSHWKPIVERRKALLAKLADWTPPPALGTMPEAANDPITVMLWGITPERLQQWAQDGDGVELRGSAAAQGVVEGPARVIKSVDQIGEVQDGEILVCGSTSPAWAPIFSRIIATVTDIGGVMSHTAIVCREYGLPAVVGTGRATGADQDRPADPGRRHQRDGHGPVIRALADLRSADEATFGGKSAHLGELLAAGLQRPGRVRDRGRGRRRRDRRRLRRARRRRRGALERRGRGRRRRDVRRHAGDVPARRSGDAVLPAPCTTAGRACTASARPRTASGWAPGRRRWASPCSGWSTPTSPACCSPATRSAATRARSRSTRAGASGSPSSAAR